MNKRIRSPGPKLVLLQLAALSFFSPTVSAQENAAADDDEDAIQEIVVTGTRIRHDEYTSPSPIQRLDVDAGRQIGVTSIAELLFRSPVTNGAQIDQTLNTNALTPMQLKNRHQAALGHPISVFVVWDRSGHSS